MAGEKQTEILSVNGKPSEYRSLNIHHTVSGFVIQVFFVFLNQDIILEGKSFSVCSCIVISALANCQTESRTLS